MLHRAVARRGPVEPARRRLGDGDHVVDGLRLHRRMHDQQVGHQRRQEHRLEVLDRVVGQARIERRVHREGGGVVEDGVAVALRFRRHRRADGAAGAAAVVDDELLAECSLSSGEQDAAHGVGAAARRIGHDHLDRRRRPIGLRRGGSERPHQRRRARRGPQHLPPRRMVVHSRLHPRGRHGRDWFRPSVIVSLARTSMAGQART